MDNKLVTYGGQAVIEGVMMRGKKTMAMAVRDPAGKIITHSEDLGGIYNGKLAKIPFLRGLILLWDSLGLGFKALNKSANYQTGDSEQKIEGPLLYLTYGFSIFFALSFFFLVPAGIGHISDVYLNLKPWLGNIIEGLSRLGLLIAYMWGIGFMPDIRRVFGYHGAEHKTINAFEAGTELIPEKVALHSIQHARCGTAFLLTLVILSIILFTILGPLSIWWRIISRILLIPVLAGISYEYIRWTGKNLSNPLIRLLIKPNLAIQSLTTREPDLNMIEVAICAFKTMRTKENGV